MKPTNLTIEKEHALIARAHQGDIEARNQLVERLLPLVKKIANRFRFARSADVADDMISEGALGLMRAIETFQPELGFRLTTYAARRIFGAIQDYLRASRPAGLRSRTRPPTDVLIHSLSAFEVDHFDKVVTSVEAIDHRPAEERQRQEDDAHLRQWFEQRLSPRDAMMFRLRFIEGLTMKEIGRRIGISESAVSVRMKKMGRLLSDAAERLKAEI